MGRTLVVGLEPRHLVRHLLLHLPLLLHLLLPLPLHLLLHLHLLPHLLPHLHLHLLRHPQQQWRLLLEVFFSRLLDDIVNCCSGSCDSLVVEKQPWAGNLGAKLQVTLPADIATYTITFETDLPVTNIAVRMIESQGNVF